MAFDRGGRTKKKKHGRHLFFAVVVSEEADRLISPCGVAGLCVFFVFFSLFSRHSPFFCVEMKRRLFVFILLFYDYWQVEGGCVGVGAVPKGGRPQRSAEGPTGGRGEKPKIIHTPPRRE